MSSPNDLYCVEWDVKPYSTNERTTLRNLNIAPLENALMVLSETENLMTLKRHDFEIS